jgi:hypothetical protein
MAGEKVYDITLKLKSKEDLFEKAEISPYSDNYQVYSYISGIEFIAHELWANTAYKRVHATFVLPPSEVVDGLEQDMKAAVKRFCQGRFRDHDHDIQATRWRGIRALIASFFILFVFIGAGNLLYSDDSLFLQIISEGLFIAGWVALWWPVDTLLFAVWEHRLDRNVWTKVNDMDITVTADH